MSVFFGLPLPMPPMPLTSYATSFTLSEVRNKQDPFVPRIQLKRSKVLTWAGTTTGSWNLRQFDQGTSRRKDFAKEVKYMQIDIDSM